MKQVVYFTKILSLFTVLSVSLNACALFLHGSNEDVEITSEPSRSAVLIEGQYIGKTPLILRMQTDKTYSIEFRQEGYENVSYKLEPHVLWGYVGLDVITGGIWAAFDFGSGACYGLESNIHIAFEKQIK